MTGDRKWMIIHRRDSARTRPVSRARGAMADTSACECHETGSEQRCLVPSSPQHRSCTWSVARERGRVPSSDPHVQIQSCCPVPCG
ncbi:hypothetical protein BaRGS_00037646 [Batillaria attramentaria]|uniref:Uncharacterized protein n=1 Tax=Batillaria attramentaria TaxID=370345 RepID=A0ABD0J821_9CAEN